MLFTERQLQELLLIVNDRIEELYDKKDNYELRLLEYDEDAAWMKYLERELSSTRVLIREDIVIRNRIVKELVRLGEEC